MHDVAVALLWHQHQPYYPDDVGHENPMPWVRLHGTKDYWGMAMLLKEVPEMRATINLVPSLLRQIEAYTEEGHQDTHLRISRLGADSLSEEDLDYLLDNFFMAHVDRMIRPHARYHELYRKRGLAIDPASRARKRFSHRDILDLQCWSNLAWMHPLVFEHDAELSAFRQKGSGWSEAEKQWLLDRQLELLRQIVPLHRELQQRGQVELTTTPYYHPILPLLWDKRLARRAMPEVALPQALEGYPEDVKEHLRRAVEAHEKAFGQKPRGLWPSEGSVGQPIIPAIAEAGFQWLATDEEILACSTDGLVARDSNGFLRNPEMLYRPWRVEEAGRTLQIIYRDHALSDMIGFQYQSFEAEHAVNDFVGRLEAIGQATAKNAGQRPTLVSVILDGENCWEYYPNAGVDFLRGLYRRIAKHPKVTPVRVGDYLTLHPATDRLSQLFPGSWIQHNFGIWLGHPECNQAWDFLDRTRKHLVERGRRRTKPTAELRRAWEELYIAEGSDWFWWFGDSHSSAQDALFDRLFRKHLQNVYLLLGEESPHDLARPISQSGRPCGYMMPSGLLRVKVDGRRTYFEWINAGHCDCRGSRGTMSMAQGGPVAELYFGFDTDHLFLRLDARGGPFRERSSELDGLRLVFASPAGYELRLKKITSRQPTVELYHKDKRVTHSEAAAAADAILELAVPFRALGGTTDDPLDFYLELLRKGKVVQRIPTEGLIETSVPSPDYEQIMWQA